MCVIVLGTLSGSSTLFLTRRKKKESILFCFCTLGVGIESVLCVCLRREFLCVYISSMRGCFRFPWCGRGGLECVVSVSEVAGSVPVFVYGWGEAQGI